MAEHNTPTGGVEIPGGILWSPAIPYAREVCKFETTHTKFGPPGKPPYVHQDYPALMYRPSRHAMGHVIFDSVTVGNEDERAKAERQGFVYGGQGEAVKRLERDELEIAKTAALRAGADRTMSAQAQAEAAKHDEATDAHVPVIPETPVRRGPGRPTATGGV